MKTACVIGASGCVGETALSLLRARPEFEVQGLSFHRNVKRALSLSEEFPLKAIAFLDESAARAFSSSLTEEKRNTLQVFSGPKANETLLEWLSPQVNVLASSGVGALSAFLKSLESGAKTLMANKESLILGAPFIAKALEKGVQKNEDCLLLPLDSEHSAALQLLPLQKRRGFPLLSAQEVPEIRSLILTASGGPFRGWSEQALSQATYQEALAHPNWTMGPKICVDSATLFNKALELIEAHVLFGLQAESLKALIHPQSVVHALWEARDGTLKMAASPPDMSQPLAFALDYPESPKETFDTLSALGRLEFSVPKGRAKSVIDLGLSAIQSGYCATIALSALNESAVSAFAKGRIRFLDIERWVGEGLSRLSFPRSPASVEEALALHEEFSAFFPAFLGAFAKGEAC